MNNNFLGKVQLPVYPIIFCKPMKFENTLINEILYAQSLSYEIKNGNAFSQKRLRFHA